MNSNPKKRYDINKAEAFANQIINDALVKRKYYLDQVYVEGQKEVDQYKIELESEYDKKVYDLSKEEKQLEEGKNKNIVDVEKQYQQRSEDVVDFLLNSITKVGIKMEKNIVTDFNDLRVTV